MAASIDGVFSMSLQEKITASNIFVVGAGGIGCEILKNLVMSGFPRIEIIDLDTIDVSNLNRQFLFHKEHVGKSKAQVAKESALSFNPNVEIVAYHDSITSSTYGVSFFKRFDLVLNALDNRQARNHVNRLCLNAGVPLIESGTAGYNGQVELIQKGLTQCYECTPKSAQKSFPGCTIRNTPSEPIHCIVWGKHLFNQLFGEANEDEDVSPDMADPEAGGDNAGANALEADSNEKGNVDRVNTRQWAQNCQFDPEKLFNKLFHDDIKYLLSMSNLWKNRTAPTPFKWGEFGEDVAAAATNGSVLPDQKIWTLKECADVFAQSVNALKVEFSKLGDGDHLVWDKDDKHAMDFVAACANIRATIFNIGVKSRFDIKSMAGNIIPAIATTNAITAGVVVMHAIKIIQGEIEKCKSVYMRLRTNARNQLLVPDRFLNPPNPKCYVCSADPGVYLKVDTNKMTVKGLRDDVLVKSLNMVDPDVILDGKGVIVISSEEGETECNNDKKLSDLGIVDGAILKVDDFVQQYELSVIIVHADAERDAPLFEVNADESQLKPKEAEPAATANGKEAEQDDEDGPSSAKKARIEVEDDDDDDLCLIEDDEEDGNKEDGNKEEAEQEEKSTVLKRKTEDNGEGSSSSKRAKIQEEDTDDDLVVLSDED